VGKESTQKNWVNSDCLPLTHVYHVAHVPTALRIIEDETLRADLVYDESLLNIHRIRVVWLSPNSWAFGSRYGNVEFQLDWLTLIAGKHLYWVESISKYSPPALRLLITDTSPPGSLEPYDPAAACGPLRLSPDGTYAWNGLYCLEIMHEGDLPLSAVTKIDFVKHHSTYCNIDYRTCRYRGREGSFAAAELLGLLASSGETIRLPGLDYYHAGRRRPSQSLADAYDELIRRCSRTRVSQYGSMRSSDPLAPSLGRALMRALCHESLGDDSGSIAAVFVDGDHAAEAVGNALAHAVGFADASVFKE
jgi:hypothetical protein